MGDEYAQEIASHLSDLKTLASQPVGSTGISAVDTTVSIENLCKNLLDEQLSGAASLLFDKASGLTSVLWSSIGRAERDKPALVELRSEVLRLIDFIHDDFTGREMLHHLGEYAVEIARRREVLASDCVILPTWVSAHPIRQSNTNLPKCVPKRICSWASSTFARG